MKKLFVVLMMIVAMSNVCFGAEKSGWRQLGSQEMCDVFEHSGYEKSWENEKVSMYRSYECCYEVRKTDGRVCIMPKNGSYVIYFVGLKNEYDGICVIHAWDQDGHELVPVSVWEMSYN